MPARQITVVDAQAAATFMGFRHATSMGQPIIHSMESIDPKRLAAKWTSAPCHSICATLFCSCDTEGA